jgi:hydroxyacylglutathione hydrolase
MFSVKPIPILNDNYVWVIIHNNKSVLIDPGSSKEVIDYHTKEDLMPTAILITHHHNDHISGVKKLIEEYSLPVYGPDSKNFPFNYIKIRSATKIKLFDNNLQLNVLEVPGHTLDHLVYFGNNMIFCGDTLFRFGCGRIFEGSYNQMYSSLQKIKKINPDSKIYCTHEYTLNNLKFLISQYPEQSIYKKYHQKLLKKNITIPFLLKDELKLNPFLFSNFEEFKRLRKAKDQF